MLKKITCIDCPQGCQLEVDVDGGHVIKVTGNKCAKGETYAKAEIENPMRVLTTTVLARGLDLKMVPVRTATPIPKAKLMEVMARTKEVILDKPVKVGDEIAPNLVATRAAN